MLKNQERERVRRTKKLKIKNLSKIFLISIFVTGGFLFWGTGQASAALVVKDSFTDTNNTNITSHTGEVGASWASHPNATATNSIVGDGLTGTTGISYATTQPTTSAYSVETNYHCGSAATPNIYVRASNTTNTWYRFNFKCAGGTAISYYIERDNAGVYGGQATASSAYSSFAGQIVNLKLSSMDEGGNVRLKAYINGELAINWLDTESNGADSKIIDIGYGAIKPACSVAYGRAENFIVRGTDSSDVIDIDEVQDKTIISRDNPATNVSNLFVMGSYNGSPASIEGRVIDASDGTTVIKDWTALTNQTMTNGFFSGYIPNVVNGGWYLTEVRFSNATSVASRAVNKVGIGIVIFTAGQSNMEFQFTTTTGAVSNDKTMQFNKDSVSFSPIIGGGASNLANTIQSATGLPVALMHYAVQSTALCSGAFGTNIWEEINSGVWSTTVMSRLWVSKVEGFLWYQGEQDARSTALNISESTYLTAFRTVISRFRTLYNNANLPIYVVPLGMDETIIDNRNEDKFNAIRWAHMDAINNDANVFLGGNGHDIPVPGNIHISDYPKLGIREGLAILRQMGLISYGRGPVLSNFTGSGTSWDITITHDGGTDFTPAIGIAGFRCFDSGGSEVAISSAVRYNATTIRITTASAVVNPNFYYVYGYDYTDANALRDNTVASLPLSPGILTSADFVDTTAPTISSFSLPATSTSRTVAVTLTATDDSGTVSGYCLTETNNSSSCSSWSGTAPTDYTFSTEGAKTLYAFARDAVPNISASSSATTTITLPTYSIGGTLSGLSGSLTLQNNGGDDLTLTDNGTFTFPTELHNSDTYAVSILSEPAEQTCTLTHGSGTVGSADITDIDITCENNPDTTDPTIDSFSLPSASDSLTVPVTLSATDNSGSVSSYCLTETNDSSTCTWSSTLPTAYTFSDEGAKTLYAFAKDAANNVSTSESATTTITLAADSDPDSTTLSDLEIKLSKSFQKVKDKIISLSNSFKLQSSGDSLINGQVKIYKDRKRIKTVNVGEDGSWQQKLKFNHAFDGTIRIKYYDQNGNKLDSDKFDLQIDTEKPVFTEPFSQTITMTKTQEIKFTATDNDQISYYKIKLLDKEGHILRNWRKQKNDTYFLPEAVTEKVQTILVRAYDRAGNFQEERAEISFAPIHTQAAEPQTPTDNAPEVQGAQTENVEGMPTVQESPIQENVIQTQPQDDSSNNSTWYKPWTWF